MRKEIKFKTWKDLISQCPPKIKKQIKNIAIEICDELASYWPYRDGRWKIMRNIYYDALRESISTKNLTKILKEPVKKLGYEMIYLENESVGLLSLGGKNEL